MIFLLSPLKTLWVLFGIKDSLKLLKDRRLSKLKKKKNLRSSSNANLFKQMTLSRFQFQQLNLSSSEGSHLSTFKNFILPTLVL